MDSIDQSTEPQSQLRVDATGWEGAGLGLYMVVGGVIVQISQRL